VERGLVVVDHHTLTKLQRILDAHALKHIDLRSDSIPEPEHHIRPHTLLLWQVALVVILDATIRKHLLTPATAEEIVPYGRSHHFCVVVTVLSCGFKDALAIEGAVYDDWLIDVFGAAAVIVCSADATVDMSVHAVVSGGTRSAKAYPAPATFQQTLLAGSGR
jgi:hypothetical protein